MTAIFYVILGLAIIGAMDLCRRWRARCRAREMARIFNDARDSYVRAMTGLRTMAGVVTQIPDAPQTLSRQGVGLLDTYAKAAASFKYMVRDLRTMSRSRALRHLTRELLKLESQEEVLRQFQIEVLRVVSDQAALETVAPPVPVRRYRAAFTVLHHELPHELWPVMDEVLASGVQLMVMDADPLKAREMDRGWKAVPVTFVNGGRAIFNRKFLERAVALRMVIHLAGHAPRIFDYTVEHERPVQPARRLWRTGHRPTSPGGPPASDSRAVPGASRAPEPTQHGSLL